ALQEAWDSANKIVAKDTKEITERFVKFNGAMIKFNQNIEEIVKKQRSNAAELVTPFITWFDNFLRTHPWAEIPAAIIHDFGSVGIEVAKQVGETLLILRAIKKLRLAMVAASAEAGAEAGAALGAGYTSSAAAGIVKGIP